MVQGDTGGECGLGDKDIGDNDSGQPAKAVQDVATTTLS